MKIAPEENLHATIFPIIARRTSNKMCALLIEVLLFNISSVSTHLDTRRVETRGMVSVFFVFLIDLDYFCIFIFRLYSL
jgi:hypothetical protein